LIVKRLFKDLTISILFFCLETKETKIQALIVLAWKLPRISCRNPSRSSFLLDYVGCFTSILRCFLH